MVSGKCYFCGSDIEFPDKIFSKDTCPKCKRDLHACVQCKFYDPQAQNQCREPMADFVRDREKRNSCTYFVFAGKTPAADDLTAAKQKLDELFKKK
jgi:hypothetical protein